MVIILSFVRIGGMLNKLGFDKLFGGSVSGIRKHVRSAASFFLHQSVSGTRRLISPVLLHALHILNLMRYGQTEVFTNIAIETYSPCNRKCNFCPVGHERRPVMKMPEELFQRIIDQLAERNYTGEIALHFYNEPTLDKRLGSFIRYAHERCPKSFIYFASNGHLLTLKKFRSYVRDGLSEVSLTQYDRDPAPPLRKFLELATNQDREHFSFRQVDENSLWSNRAGHVPGNGISSPIRQRCQRPEWQLVVNAAGKVAQCCCDYRPSAGLGDVASENVFEIWRGNQFRSIRAELRKGNRATLALCRYCDWPEEVFRLPRSRWLQRHFRLLKHWFRTHIHRRTESS